MEIEVKHACGHVVRRKKPVGPNAERIERWLEKQPCFDCRRKERAEIVHKNVPGADKLPPLVGTPRQIEVITKYSIREEVMWILLTQIPDGPERADALKFLVAMTDANFWLDLFLEKGGKYGRNLTGSMIMDVIAKAKKTGEEEAEKEEEKGDATSDPFAV